ncbi:hypothetical protein LINPERPRIM_LOCUS18497 [Linum perenne]
MALRLMKLGNTLIKQVTSPPSTRLSTRMERRFSKQASHVPIKDQEKEAAREGVLPIWVCMVFAGYLLWQIDTEISRDLEAYQKKSLEAVEQRTENLKREEDKLTQRLFDDLESEMVKLSLKKHWITEPKRSDIGREN